MLQEGDSPLFVLQCSHRLRGIIQHKQKYNSEMKVRKKSHHISESQKEALLSFMEKEEHLRSNNFTIDFTYRDAKRKWVELTKILNAIPGHRKDWKTWKTKWQGIRRTAKLKEGDECISEYDMRVLELINSEPDREIYQDNKDINMIEHCIETQNIADIDPLMVQTKERRDRPMKLSKVVKNKVMAEKSRPRKPRRVVENEIMAENSTPVTGIREEDLLIKEHYYEEKLKIMKRDSQRRGEHLNLMKRDVEAREKIADALEKIIINNSIVIRRS